MDMNEYIDELAGKIREYNRLYRQGTPAVSDTEYDRLVDELRGLCSTHEWFKGVEPAHVPADRKRKLPVPMKSLNKAKNFTELQAWVRSLGLPDTAAIVVTPKFDGVSWLHDERTGETYSRGGSENEGQDCTPHYKKGGFDWRNMSHHSFNTSFQLPAYTFGELVFFRKDWEEKMKGKVSESTGEPYRSPRNTAAGFINSDTPSPMLRHTTFFRYGVDEGSCDLFSSYADMIEWLCEYYKQPKMYAKTRVDAIDEAVLGYMFEEWRSMAYIDGLVIYIDSLHLWHTIGRHQTTGNPMYAIAYKHPDFTDTFETTVNKVNWRVSKSGALKPVVNIDTVDTGDCNMENPTGYNASWIADNHIAPGAKILVTRSGGVIPKILSVLQEPCIGDIEIMWDELAECPECGAPTKWNQNNVELLCTNPECPGVRLAKIVFFFKIIGCDNVGEEVLTRLFQAGYTTIPSILDITAKELLRIEGFGESTANTILEFNRRARSGVDAATLMHASDCFAGIGKLKARKFLDGMDDALWNSFLSGRYVEDYMLMPNDINFKALPVNTQNFVLGYGPFMKFLEETRLTPVLQITEVTSNRLSGYAVCFSGIRDAEVEQEILNNGGKVVSGVSKNTTHLVVRDVTATSGKILKAKQYGVKIIDIDSFKESLKL